MGMKKLIRRELSTTQLITLGFFVAILTGALLLMLPCSSADGTVTPFADCLFTSATSVCVTGLVVVTTATHWSFFGKLVILGLIQLGGLGIISFTTGLMMLLRKRITLRDRVLLEDSLNLDTLKGLVRFLKRIFKGTFVVEGVGALCYSFLFVPMFVEQSGLVKGGLRGIWYSIFHSVSAFCNAGIDILGENSLADYVTNPIINVTTVLLIILSGIGFTVWFDVISNSRKLIRHEIPGRWWFTRLRLHSKLAIIMTLILILSGTVFVFLFEYKNLETIGELGTGQKLLASAFQSVTTRTAGFYTVSQGALHEETKLFCAILMFIGGSPGGTAGGVKTTTFAMLFLACLTFVRGGNDTECMGRKITAANFRSGFCVVMVAFTVFIVGTITILIIEPDSILLINVIYETASAVGTVGLTADLTPHLSRASQCILMIMMYIGRLGPLTLALMFAGKTHPRDQIRRLPEEQVMVG